MHASNEYHAVEALNSASDWVLDFKDDTDRWLQLNGPVIFSYFYSKCYLKLVL